MDNQDNDFDRIENAAADRRRQQNTDDLNNEMSGNEVGRISRFLSGEAHQILLDKKNGKSSAAMTALDLVLMNNPAYAVLYENTMDRLSELEQVTQRAINRTENTIQDQEDALKNTLRDTQRLPDGTHIFRKEDGSVWTEFDERVKESDSENIEWWGNEPTYQQFQQQRAALEDSQGVLLELRTYQADVLGSARERLTNPHNPLNEEQLRDMQSEFDAQMSHNVKTAIAPNSVPEIAHDPTQFDVTIPKI